MYGQAPINYKGPISDDSVIHASAPLKVDASLQNQVTIFGDAPINYKGPISKYDSLIHGSAPINVDASLQNLYTECAEFMPPAGYAGLTGYQAPLLQEFYDKECKIYNP
jgi:hypothetical protein